MESEPGAPAASTSTSTGTTTTTTSNASSTTTTTSSTTTSSSSSGSSSTQAACSINTSTSTATSTPPASSSTTTSSSSTNNTSGSISTSSISISAAGRHTMPQISIYSGIPDRQTVQVFQQALHRQPNTAAQYLQQMYAAQQQHLMLQTAALQQQHSLSTAQLQSLAAVQQASIAAGRQSSPQNGPSSPSTGSTQTTINLTTSPAAAQLISRAQSISSTPTSISQQAVLLGSPSSPTLTATQAQMYLHAQMAQQSNLVQVARSLGRAVPLSPQLIFTPAATVTAVQSESSSQTSSQNQVQNLAIRGQQGATTSPSQTQTLQALSLKQSPVPIQPASLVKNANHGPQVTTGIKAGPVDGSTDGGKKGESGAINMSRNVTAVSAQPLLAPAYTQIQPHSLVQPHKQQFVVHQSPSSQRMTGQMVQTASVQPSPHPLPVLPKPASHQPSALSQHATIFHSTIKPHALHSSLNHSKAQPVQLTAINLQIQPAASRLAQDSKDKPTSLVLRETCQTPSVQQQQQQQQQPPQLQQQQQRQQQQQQQQLQQQQQQQLQQQPQQQQQQPPPPAAAAATPSLPPKSVEQPKANPGTQAVQSQGVTSCKRPSVPAESPPPPMTSGNESEAPAVTGHTPHNGESKLPQAIVKPQVLTHVIEGFVIQEGAEPFPVCVDRLPVLIDSPKKLDQLSSDPDKTPVSNAANSDSDDMHQPEKEPMLTCEYCGAVNAASTFKGSKRFCSVVCAKRYNVGCTKRMGLFHPERSKPANLWRRRSQGRPSVEAKKRKLSPLPKQSHAAFVSTPHTSQPCQEESSPCSDMSSYEEPPSPLSAASSGPAAPAPASAHVPVHRQPSRASDQEGCTGRDSPSLCQRFFPNDPANWNVEEVYEFIQSLPGCQEIADEFRSQEIDGQALLLLKEDHLMSTMNIKLGPALKIFARINMLKDS
ncbi:polyhomeotic-like protein 2b [Gouania willdenowi]|uniref:Polyhomeotic-like protein 2 n=1 Tax=Gouania willdenowi TaxID=441366 RepID=A0A8C5HMI5_GOUWI|nr:polyhomeotic-like protein 2 [Gouania willdenowi]